MKNEESAVTIKQHAQVRVDGCLLIAGCRPWHSKILICTRRNLSPWIHLDPWFYFQQHSRSNRKLSRVLFLIISRQLPREFAFIFAFFSLKFSPDVSEFRSGRAFRFVGIIVTMTRTITVHRRWYFNTALQHEGKAVKIGIKLHLLHACWTLISFGRNQQISPRHSRIINFKRSNISWTPTIYAASPTSVVPHLLSHFALLCFRGSFVNKLQKWFKFCVSNSSGPWSLASEAFINPRTETNAATRVILKSSLWSNDSGNDAS